MADLIDLNDSKKSNTKRYLYTGILGISLIILITVIVGFIYVVGNIQETTSYLNKVNSLNRHVQRIVKMKIADENVRSLLASTQDALSTIHIPPSYLNSDSKYQEALAHLNTDWYSIRDEIFLADRVGWKATKLLFTSERYYYTANVLIRHIESELHQLTNFLYTLQVATLCILFTIAIATTVLVKNLVNTIKLAQLALIDLPTSIFNRSACDIFLQRTVSVNNGFESVLILFDLNDLKKVNDTFGHKTGDDLLRSFAKLIKASAETIPSNYFLGRYGGDEFILYFDSINEEGLKDYFAHLEAAREDFNHKVIKYQISYASGYIFIRDYVHDTDYLLKDLLEFADDKMYENKKQIKALRAEKAKLERSFPQEDPLQKPLLNFHNF